MPKTSILRPLHERLASTLIELTKLRPAPRVELDLESIIALVSECEAAMRPH